MWNIDIERLGLHGRCLMTDLRSKTWASEVESTHWRGLLLRLDIRNVLARCVFEPVYY